MLKFMMGFQIIFMFIFFIGINVEANPVEHCMKIVEFSDYNSAIKITQEEDLDAICPNITSFIQCINTAMQAQTGYNIKQLAVIMNGTDTGKALKFIVNIQELFEEICTEGSEFRQDFLSNAQCFNQMDKNMLEECEDQAKAAFGTFRELHAETVNGMEELDEHCMIGAYQMGCGGAAVQEQCGDEGFEVFKKVVKRVGLFKSGICSSNILHITKTSFMESLDMPESRKDLYRTVLELRKRRK